MKNIKKCLENSNGKKNGIYVHYSPPTMLDVSPEQLRQWILKALDNKLERMVLAGQGRRLLVEAEALPLARHIITLIEKCNGLHAAVEKGSLLELQELLYCDYNRNKYVMCLDEAGVGLLHKAVFYNFIDIVEWLVDNFPYLVHQKDSLGRTPLHYTAISRDALLAGILERAGAARGARDAAGRTLAHYRTARTLLALPDANMPRQPGLVIKRHNIRIWCHECDMGRLQRVVWEGQGARLLSEVSSQPIVKKFLEVVPYIMNTIRDIHNAVIQNDLETLMKLTADPVPPQALSSKDANNLTAMHKAAGLGHGSILKYIVERYPQGINEVDNDGRTPLHYAAIVKDEQHTYNTLISSGADEGAVDNKNKTPAYYINRPQDIDKNVFKILPDAPRTPSSSYPSSWDWKMLDTNFTGDFKKSRKKNLKASSENISSKNNTTTISDNTENENSAMKNSSTHELISDLPDLNDSEKPNSNNIPEEDNILNKDTTETENIIEPIVKSDTDEDMNENNMERLSETNESSNKEPEECINTETLEEETHTLENFNHKHTNGIIDNENETENLATENHSINEETESERAINDTEVIEDHNTNSMQEDTVVITGNYNKNANDTTRKEEIENEKNEHHKTNTEFENTLMEEIKVNEGDNAASEATANTALDSLEIVSQSESGKEETHLDIKEIQDDGKKDQNYEDIDHHNNHDSESDLTGCDKNVEEDHITSHEGNNGRNIHENPIEGIIRSEAELETEDASIRDGYNNDILIVDNEIDPEVTDLINTANMEMLATLVLNGEGSRLIGRQSRNTELQAFLNNVPNYMEKINKVHLAAKDGNIRDLQAALDRRKFAIARDPISANGAAPLHVATIFGKTNIIKYLGGRFPETLSAVDFEGRTALHYAAVLPDNGHYYNILQQLGANSKDLDDNGRSAEDYYKNPTLFPFNQLLTDFSISDETARTMFSDKVPDDHVSSRRNLEITEVLDTLERCYRLLASARPSRTPLSASSNKATPPHVLGRFLKKHIFDLVKHRITKLDHNLFDVIWPAVKKLPDTRNILQTVEEDFPGGVTAPDYYVYEVFAEFFTPLIKDLHNINVSFDLPNHPTSDFIKNIQLESSDPLVELNIDPGDEFVLSGTMECSRNIDGFELPLNLKIGKLETIERIITTILMREDFGRIIEQLSPESDQKGGTYYTLNEILEKPSEISAMLASAGLLISLCERDEIDDSNRLHGKHWPYGRGVFVSDDKTVAIWINVHDHIRILTTTPTDAPGEIGLTFSKLSYIMKYLHEKLDFVWDLKLGHLSCRPTFLGAGIRFSLIVNFPGLTKDSDNMKHLCAMRGLQYRETLSSDIARVSNYQCLNITESNCFNDFATATSNLLHLERDLSMQDSAHIANMLSNIFRKKRSSLADIHDSLDRIQEKH